MANLASSGAFHPLLIIFGEWLIFCSTHATFFVCFFLQTIVLTSASKTAFSFTCNPPKTPLSVSFVTRLKRQFRVFVLPDEMLSWMWQFENCPQLLIAFDCCACLNIAQWFLGRSILCAATKSGARESVVIALKRFAGTSFEQIPGSLPEQSIYLAPFTAQGPNACESEFQQYLKKSWQCCSARNGKVKSTVSAHGRETIMGLCSLQFCLKGIKIPELRLLPSEFRG